ncbi:MAG: Rpn family recombination-promoting nuclease/putative transposase [Eubacterium sp.]|nr:Rpn family recombination-promoting nuclease/putative transposase [Eubacterium sp.]
MKYIVKYTNNNKTTESPGELSHIRDVNSKDIFKNNVLTSQFLKDYSGISFFSDVKPEDIEDQTSRFRFLLGIEVEGDTIKKIQVRIGDRQEEVYVISLIEHKSQVDYDVAMQLLHYMSVIWKDYARKCNEQKRDSNKAKSFRYPLIIPIVYYEGAEKWTAGPNLSDRISHAHLIMECIPDFTYKIVPLREYRYLKMLRRERTWVCSLKIFRPLTGEGLMKNLPEQKLNLSKPKLILSKPKLILSRPRPEPKLIFSRLRSGLNRLKKKQKG